MPLEKLIEQRLERLESVPNKLLSTIQKNEETVFKQILKDLNGLETKDGKITASKSNLAKINGILENLKKTLINEDYVNAIKEFAVEIGTQAKISNKILDATISSFSDDELFKSTVLKSQQNALALLDENAVTSEFLQPISEILTSSIVSEMSFSDAVEMLRSNIVGENAIYSKYATTYAKDAFSISDRQYNQLIARSFGIEFYKYDGVKVKATRYFCCVRKKKIFHIKEIESWGEKESLWNNPKDGGSCENAKGGGRNPDTNKYNIMSLLGGYGCQDVLLPVAIEYVPESVKNEARAKGYYTGL